MLTRTTLTTSKAGAAMGLLLIGITACHHQAAPPPHAASGPPKVKFNETYDPEIKEIMELAGKDRWEEAQAKADALFLKAPQNVMVEPVHTWVLVTRDQRRQQALED